MPEFPNLIQSRQHPSASPQQDAVAGEALGTVAIKTPDSLLARVYGLASGAVGAVAGITPHVLHHIGPIAGAAILTGTEGSVLFGAIGFVLTLPLLLRLKKRFNSWAAPGVALGLFAIMFTVSTLWIGPAIRGDNDSNGTAPVDPHHASMTSPVFGEGLFHTRWLGSAPANPSTIFLTHGEPQSATALAGRLRSEGLRPVIPNLGEVFEFDWGSNKWLP